MPKFKECSCRICKDMFVSDGKIFCNQIKETLQTKEEVPINCTTMRTYRKEEKRLNRFSRIFIPVGPSGVGKTTLRNSCLKGEPDLKIISPDDIREEILNYKETGNAFDVEKEDKVWETAYKQLSKAAESQHSIFFDATNLTYEKRNKIKEIAGPNYIVIIFVFRTSLDEVLKRNNKRSKKVPEEIIIQQYTKRELPSFNEGYLCFIGGE